MDHFNITLQKDGVSVTTRRGMQVEKQKHRGLSFVNSFTPRQSTATQPNPRPPPANSTQPSQQQWRFVDKNDTRRAAGKAKAKPKGVHGSGTEPQTNQSRRTPRRHSEKTPLTRLPTPASSSGSERDDPTAEAIASLQDFYATSPGGLVLPTWASLKLPLTEQEQRLFYGYFTFVPRKMYPFEDILTFNPARNRLFFEMVINDLAAMHCVLMCNSMFKAVLTGRVVSEQIAFHISKICSVINKVLDKKPKKIPGIILECITTLALMGNFIGRYDHWHVHMMGLQKMVNMNGGWEGMRPSLLDKIRKTDLKGAATLGTVPYLPFTRTHAPISDILPLPQRLSTRTQLAAALTPLSIPPIVTTSLTSLSLFVQAIHLAHTAQPKRSILFEPHAFTEELHWVQHQLICHPGPLRAGGARPADLPLDVSTLRTENYVLNHHAPLRVPILPSPPEGSSSAAETAAAALRICGLLYLKELMPDFPRNLGGYQILLSLLRQHLERAAHARAGDGAQREVDMAVLRPVMLWVALVGNEICRVADENECRFGSDCYDRGIYGKVLAELMDGVEGGVDGLGEGDLVLFRLLDIRRIRGERWDYREEVGRILNTEKRA